VVRLLSSNVRGKRRRTTPRNPKTSRRASYAYGTARVVGPLPPGAVGGGVGCVAWRGGRRRGRRRRAMRGSAAWRTVAGKARRGASVLLAVCVVGCVRSGPCLAVRPWRSGGGASCAWPSFILRPVAGRSPRRRASGMLTRPAGGSGQGGQRGRRGACFRGASRSSRGPVAGSRRGGFWMRLRWAYTVTHNAACYEKALWSRPIHPL
jgi:hypothetical protein